MSNLLRLTDPFLLGGIIITKYLKKIIAIMFLTMIFVSFVNAAEPLVFKLTPNNTNVKVGESFELIGNINTPVKIAAFEMVIKYDKSILQFEKVEFLGLGKGAVSDFNEVANGVKVVYYDGTGGSNAISSGDIYKVVFKVLKIEDTTIEAVDCEFADENANKVSFIMQDTTILFSASNNTNLSSFINNSNNNFNSSGSNNTSAQVNNSISSNKNFQNTSNSANKQDNGKENKILLIIILALIILPIIIIGAFFAIKKIKENKNGKI